MSVNDQNTTLVQLIKDFKSGNCVEKHHENVNKRKHSDEFTTPEKKTCLNHNQYDISSPWEERRTKLELIETRNRILVLESQVKQLHGVRRELEVVFENEKQALQDQQARDRNLINELETRLNVVRKREVETRGELTEAKHKLELNKINFDKKLQKLQHVIDQLNDEQSESTSNDQDQSFAANQRIDELEEALTAAEDDADAQKQLVEELQSQLSAVNATNRELEMKEHSLQNALLKIKELEYEKASYLEWQQQAKIQQNKITTNRELEKEVDKLRDENKNLRDAIHNKLLLEEQVMDLQKRVDLNKNLQQEIAEFEAKFSYVESQLNEWNSLARDICDGTNTDQMLPRHLKQMIEQMQQKEIILTSEKISLESDLQALKRESTGAKHETEKLNKQVTELQILHKNHQTLIHRLQKKLLLVSRERDSYRSQLDSYEKELTISLGPSGPSKSVTDLQKERLEGCERTIDGYKDLVAKLEADLEVAQSLTATSVPVRTDQVQRLQADIAQLRTENEKILKQRTNLEREMEQRALSGESEQVTKLKTELIELQSQNEKLKTESVNLMYEMKHLKSELDSLTGTKVLHLKANPMTEASTKFDNELLHEVERLKKKIRSLEEGIENSKTESSFVGNSQEIQALREQVKSYELKSQRLKEVFKSTSQEFRDVCYMLFGYKIDRISSSNYRLTSMYAETNEDYLSFHYNEGGTLNLLETPFSSTLDELIQTHLLHHQSIPLFVGSVTVHLFNKITLQLPTVEV